MFIGKYNSSVILTYIGVCFALMGMFFGVRDKLTLSMVCLIVSGICDLFDGTVARRCKRDEEEKEFGVQIDSLADVVSFLALPAVLGLCMIKEWQLQLWTTSVVVPRQGVDFTSVLWTSVCLMILMVYILCGIIRLAWFNLRARSEEGGKFYEGLPVTFVALILPIVYLVGRALPGNAFYILMAVTYLIIAICFILRVKIKKPGGVWCGVFAVLAIVVITLLLTL